MRKSIRFISFFLVIQTVVMSNMQLFGQKIKPVQVPSDVLQTVEYQNPGAKVQSWEKDGGNYRCNFKDQGIQGQIFVTPDGKWLRTIYMVPESELPSSITNYVKKNYPDFIISMSCTEELENESEHYYIETKMSGIGFEPSILTFDYNGNLLGRKDPAGFKDPLAMNEEPKPVTQPETADKATPSNTKAGKTAAAKTPAKPAKEAKPAKPDKPAVEKPKKPAKPKKAKPEPVVTDENGNVALKPAAIPEPVKKAFSKKVFHPEELNWFMIDSMYVAKCMNAGKKTAAYITPGGVWAKTLVVQPEEAVTGPMLKYLNDYYAGFRFKSAILELRADRNNKTVVQFYEKANYKQKLATTAVFDKSGKLIRTVDPDYTMGAADEESPEDEDLERYYEKMNMGLSDEDAVNVPENVAAAFRLKYPRVKNVAWEEEDLDYLAVYYDVRGKQICVINPYGTIVETRTLGKPANFSETIAAVIKKEFKGFKVDEYYTVKKIAEHKSFYKVMVTHKKTGEEKVLWFNTAGKMVDL